MIKPLYFLQDSRKLLKSFPEKAQDALGHALYQIQCGEDPPDWKPMSSIGQGVSEIRPYSHHPVPSVKNFISVNQRFIDKICHIIGTV